MISLSPHLGFIIKVSTISLFTMSDVLIALIDPLMLSLCIIALGGVCLYKRYWRLATGLVLTGLMWLTIWFLPVGSLWLGGFLERLHPYRSPEQAPHADSILVLGGHTAHHKQNWFLPREEQALHRRTDTAAALYLAGKANRIIVSGGGRSGDHSEAYYMAERLRQKGIPEVAIVQEPQSRTTRENMHFVAPLLAPNETVLLVTSSLHMPRAIRSLHALHPHAIAWPTPPQIVATPSVPLWWPHMPTFKASRSIIKEYAALWLYQWRGWFSRQGT